MDNSTNSTFFNSSSNSTYEGWQQQQAPKSFWTNLTLPVLYLTILIGSLYTFSSLYRKRKIAKAASLEPWFPAHKQRDIYLSLLHLDPSEAGDGGEGEKKLSKVPDSVLKAALMQRALEDIRRIVQLRNSKPALQSLLQRGSVGEELWQRFQVAEKAMEEEVKDVVNEANAFTPGWGQVIFQSANEMNQHIIIKERIAEIQSKLPEDKAWWENKRAGYQSELFGESETNGNGKAVEPARPKTSSDDDTVLVEGGGPAGTQGASKKKKKKQQQQQQAAQQQATQQPTPPAE